MVILGLGVQFSYGVSVRMPPLKFRSLDSYMDTYSQEVFNVKTELFSICTEPWRGGKNLWLLVDTRFFFLVFR